MDTWRFLLPALAACALAGCHSMPRTGAQTGLAVKPALVMIPLEQVPYYRETLHGGDSMRPAGSDAITSASVQAEPGVSAVLFNRYPDPARPDELMHEAHIVYRREGGLRWRLRSPSKDEQILVGPQLTDGRGEIRSLASQELEAYVHQQRENLRQQQSMMSSVAESIRQLAQQQQALAEEVGRMKTRPGAGGHVSAGPETGTSDCIETEGQAPGLADTTREAPASPQNRTTR